MRNRIERTKRFQSKLNLVLKNPTFGLKLTQDNTQYVIFEFTVCRFDDNYVYITSTNKAIKY